MDDEVEIGMYIVGISKYIIIMVVGTLGALCYFSTGKYVLLIGSMGLVVVDASTRVATDATLHVPD